MGLTITKTNDLSQSYFRGVVYGPSGAGKTSLVKTVAAAGFKPLLAEVVPYEDGTLSISDTPIDHARIAAVTDKEMTTAMKERGYISLQELLTGAAELPHDVLYIEGISSLSTLYLNRAKKESTNVWDQYRKLAEDMTTMLLHLKTIEKHVIFTAHHDVIKSPADLEVYTPLVDGNAFPRQLPGLIDAMLYLNANIKGERHLITRYDGKRVAKLRYPGSAKIEMEIEADLGNLMKTLGFKPAKNRR
jgi:hypothetical protein